MRIVGVLTRIRKRLAAGTALPVALLLAGLCCAPALPARAAPTADPLPGRGEDSLDMGTRTGGAAIGKDPAGGDNVMSTPPARAQQQDNRTILVVPQVEPSWRQPGVKPRAPDGARPQSPAVKR